MPLNPSGMLSFYAYSMNRRTAIQSIAALVTATAASSVTAAVPSMPIIDAHIHLFDPTRPGGVPWPTPQDKALYKPALPSRYAPLAEPHGIVGAIAIEASPWLIDNFWLLGQCAKNPVLLGFIGDLSPESPDFTATLDHLHRSPFFLGIRYGNLWNRNILAASSNPAFISGLKTLAQADLVLETANPDADLIAAVLRISDQVPSLRIVLDHLPNATIPTDAAKRAEYDTDLHELSHRPQIYVKGSEIVRRIGNQVPLDLAAYKDSLDRLWSLFGEDRIFFGSDWPNSDSVATYDQIFRIAQSYIATRGPAAQQKYFSKNSIAVYRWKARTAAQQHLLDTA